jgi:hypothetical protein
MTIEDNDGWYKSSGIESSPDDLPRVSTAALGDGLVAND